MTQASSHRLHGRCESGQITAMLVLLGICLLLAIIAVIDISGSYLRRQAVASLADGAALSASDSAVAAGIYRGTCDGPHREPALLVIIAASIMGQLTETGGSSSCRSVGWSLRQLMHQ
jgi:Putative Flp pilus-assembly TadE/G-like